jgi:Flp pilus assembly protein TadD
MIFSREDLCRPKRSRKTVQKLMIDRYKLNKIIYISLPDHFQRNIGTFSVDPAILLPVYIPAGMDDDFSISDLSWEMIISAMIKILAWDPTHEHIDYFRDFVLTVKPDIVSELTATAIEKARELEYELSEELFRASAELDKEDEKTILNLAFMYEQMIKLYLDQKNNARTESALDDAYATYLKALERHPESPTVCYNAAYFFLLIQNPEKARDYLDRFLSIAPEDDSRRSKVEMVLSELLSMENTDSLFTEAYDAIRAGREGEGIEKIRRYLENRPDDWNGWFLLGWARRKTEAWQDAKEAFEKALELESGNVDLFNELAICLMELEEYATCRIMLEKALKLEPENIKVLSNMAILFMKTGRRKEALDLFKAVTVIDPEDPVAPRFIEALTENF